MIAWLDALVEALAVWPPAVKVYSAVLTFAGLVLGLARLYRWQKRVKRSRDDH